MEGRFATITHKTALDAQPSKLTKECFVGELWGFRDSDFDALLAACQLESDQCVAATLAMVRGWSFRHGAEALPGVERGLSFVQLGYRLIELDYVMSLPQMEQITALTESGADTGMRNEGWGNFFFVPTQDPDNPVTVVGVDRRRYDWFACIRRLDRSEYWSTDIRLIVRNPSSSKA